MGRDELLPRCFPNRFFGGTEQEMQFERRGVLSPITHSRYIPARKRAAVAVESDALTEWLELHDSRTKSIDMAALYGSPRRVRRRWSVHGRGRLTCYGQDRWEGIG